MSSTQNELTKIQSILDAHGRKLFFQIHYSFVRYFQKCILKCLLIGTKYIGTFSTPNLTKCYLSREYIILCVYLVVVDGLCVALQMLFFFAGVFIVAAKRTPFGTYGGVLKDHSATDLAEHAAKAALAAGAVAPEIVNSVIVGNVMQVQ